MDSPLLETTSERDISPDKNISVQSTNNIYFRFSDLPAEIRIMIYEYLLREDTTVHVTAHHGGKLKTGSKLRARVVEIGWKRRKKERRGGESSRQW